MESALVDTSIWSLALRTRDPADYLRPWLALFTELLLELRVAIIGPVRQEILSGIREEGKFETLKAALSPLPDLALCQEDFETAAAFFNRARSRGIQGSHADFLICAVAASRSLPILSLDDDFKRYATILPVRLIGPAPRPA